ncbi:MULTISPECIES: MaoC family dehydratase N-terminal domain-containing protein [Saccharopolyspora]|uniref:UPF0336 protein AB8O55_23885 n=1 Tax=Saccharopolyspora cebuensis TaxID=418759 RepID=A0ABV4CR85_9PSEU
MPLDQSFIGRQYPPGETYEVGREKIREFAEAIGADSPVHRDAAAAQAAGHPDVIAPPTFAVLLSMRAHDVLVHDPQLGLDYARMVHGQQEFTHHRPIVAGDRLVTAVAVDDVKERAGNDFLTVRAEIATEAGAPVCTATSLLVVRGAEGDAA